jgi:hypothetical protein
MAEAKLGPIQSPTYKDFRGGLNIRDAAHVIKDNECTEAQNVYFNADGGVNKRGGWTRLVVAAVGTTSNLIGVYQAAWVNTGTVTRKVIATDGVKIFWLNGTAWTEITGALTMTTADNTIVSFIQMNNLLIGYDGKNAPWKWDGAAASASALAGTPPTGNIATVWQNRMWWAGTALPTRLYYSAAADPESYPATGYIDVPSAYDGEAITGLAILYGNLIIFKRYSIYILQGSDPDNFILSKTNSSVGCVSPYSVVSVDNLVYFVSDKGLYAMNLSNTRQLCYKVEPRYNLAAGNQLNGTLYRNRIMGLHYRKRNQVWMLVDASAAGQDTHDRIMVHDYVVVDENGDPAASEYVYGDYAVASAVVSVGGSGYQVGDQLSIVGPSSPHISADGVAVVATLSGSAVATVTISAGGTGYVNGGTATTTKITGAGSGCILTVTTRSVSNAPSVITDYIDSSGTVVPMASFYDKYVYYYSDSLKRDMLGPQSSGSDVTIPFIVRYATKAHDFGDSYAFKVLRWIRTDLLSASGTPRITFTKQDGIGQTATSLSYSPVVSTFWNTRSVIPYAAAFGAPRAKYWTIKIQEDVSGNSFVLYSYGFELIWKGRRL